MKEYTIGMLGAGFMGKTHTYAYTALPFYYPGLPFRVRLKTVYSRTLANAEALCAYGYEQATDCADDILNDKDIDVLDICTPNLHHYDLLCKGLSGGKHIYCEKPLASSYAEAAAVAELAKTAAGKCQVVFNNRFLPATLRAKEMIDEGRLGRILSFRTVFLHAGSVDPNRPIGWKQDGAQAGGVIFDLASHALDLLCHLLGNVASVTCQSQILYPTRPDKAGNRVAITAEDAAYMLLTMENGAMGTCEVTKIATGANDELRLEIHGDKGAISINLADPEWLEFYDNTVPNETLGGTKGYTKIECMGRYPAPAGVFPGPKYSVGWLRGHVHSLYSFLQAIDKGQTPSPSASEGAYVQYVMEKALQSAQSGVAVKL